jgi:two-component system sensor histidine kinase UhpB
MLRRGTDSVLGALDGWFRALNWRGLWRGRSVRTQLLIAIGAVNLLAALAAIAVSVPNTRLATKAEVESSLEVAEGFVKATVKDLAAQGRLDQLAERLPVELKDLRHVRIMLVDSFGNLTVFSAQPDPERAPQWTAPQWFKDLVGPRAGRAVRLVAAGKVPVIIVGNPAVEINEAWEDYLVLVVAWLVLNALVLLALHAILGRVLDPLVNLARGMVKLKDGDYATRLDPPKVKEIAAITNRFNMLAAALEAARKENSTLYRQLISVQERERREIATELHDEAGPCLFGITANASSIRTLADQLGDQRTPELTQRVGEVLTITERLKLMNRALLKKLRPGPLGHVGLAQLLDELIAGFQQRHPETKILPAIGKLASSYGEAIDLTLYRCVQDGVANAIGEHEARTVLIELAEQAPRSRGKARRSGNKLKLVLRDDGTGRPRDERDSFALALMKERVRSQGGTCVVKRAPKAGTTVRVEIPIARAALASKKTLELAESRRDPRAHH